MRPSPYLVLALALIVGPACSNDNSTDSTPMPLSGEIGVAEFNVQGMETKEVLVSNGTLEGFALRLPGSSLSAPAKLQISESPAIAGDVAKELGITIPGALSRSVAVLPEKDPATRALQEQMRLSIPLLLANSALADGTNYAVAFRCWIKGKAKTGLIKGSSVTVDDNKATFKVKWFGVFQVVTIADDVVATEITPQDSVKAISGGT